MKVSALVWLATLVMVILLAGKSIDQLLLAGEIGFFGFVMGVVGGTVSSAFNKTAQVRSARRIR